MDIVLTSLAVRFEDIHLAQMELILLLLIQQAGPVE
jgi:hypothetical protein